MARDESTEDDIFNLLNEVLPRMGSENTVAIPLRLQSNPEHEEAVRFLGGQIQVQRENIDLLDDNLRATYLPDNRSSFLDAGKFEEYPTLSFLYRVAETIDHNLQPALDRLESIADIVDRMPADEDSHPDPPDMHRVVASKNGAMQATEAALQTIALGVLPFGELVRRTYKQAISHYRYLQKRFCNIGIDDGRAYRNPLEAPEEGYDLSRVPPVKAELIDDSPMLTDVLLDIAERIPNVVTRKVRAKGRRKPQEKRFIDPFSIDLTARILAEIATPEYQRYLRNPRSYLTRIADSLRQYHSILSPLEGHLREVLRSTDIRLEKLRQLGFDFRQPLEEPHALLSRLEAIDYNSIRPDDDDLRPANDNERRGFAARQRLLDHLAGALTSISRENVPDKQYALAKAAVERAVRLKEQLRKTQATKKAQELRRDAKVNNEFYVGASGQLGEFRFEREAAPTVRLKDIYGKSFDVMKQHIEDLAEYANHLHLYGATAPRGKIRSNIIAIGPYGCGKTEIGRAIAGDPRFIGAEVAVTDLLTAWFGEFEKNIDRVWDAARELRRNSSDKKLVFLLMDEFDSWFNSTRGHWVDQTYKRAQKAIQQKLDGVVDYEGIITVGFTNEPAGIPLAIYRRFKYVDIVGELEHGERKALLNHFLSAGLPLSSGFRDHHYNQWATLLDGATGDVIGKVTDDLHYEFMRTFISEHPKEARSLDRYVARSASNGNDLDKPYVKREIGRYLRVTPDSVDRKIRAKLAEPIIREQIDTARRVYAEARDVLSKLHQRTDAASGIVNGEGTAFYRGPAVQ